MTAPGAYSGGAPAVGARVTTADGDELGTVKEVSGGCFKVDAPMQPDYWLASDCIADAAAGGVRLRISKDQLSDAKLEGPEHTGVHRHQDGDILILEPRQRKEGSWYSQHRRGHAPEWAAG